MKGDEKYFCTQCQIIHKFNSKNYENHKKFKKKETITRRMSNLKKIQGIFSEDY